MRKIKQSLGLRAQGMSVADIAISTGAGRTTVYEYLARAESAGIGWPLPDDLDEETLEEIVPTAIGGADRTPAGAGLAGGAQGVEEGQARHAAAGVAGVAGGQPGRLGLQPVLLALSAVASRSGRGDALVVYGRGEKFVDFSGDTTCWTDPDSGEVYKAEVFVAVLGASGMLYAQATRGGRTWGRGVGAHGRLGALWGVTTLTVPD
jgi:hypothetical protein